MTVTDWEEIVDLLILKGLQLSIAESCTGGHISDIITNVPGASRCFKGGVVAYSNMMKTGMLKVDEGTLLEHGAVSRETAIEMSRGILEQTSSDISLSITGIAGPTGGTDEKPVGTVFISVSLKDDRNVCEGFLLEGIDRVQFKTEVSTRALGMVKGGIAML